jgi:hypothetical protein
MSKVEPWQGTGSRLPNRRQRRLRTRLKAGARRAAQVRTDPDDHQVFGLDCTSLVLGVFGRRYLVELLRLGIKHFPLGLLERRQHFRRPSHQPHRITAPLNPAEFAGRHAADIGFDRRRPPPWHAPTAGSCSPADMPLRRRRRRRLHRWRSGRCDVTGPSSDVPHADRDVTGPPPDAPAADRMSRTSERPLGKMDSGSQR